VGGRAWPGHLPVHRLADRGGSGPLTDSESRDQLVDDAADELYGLPPDEFTAARDERVKAARAAGDRELAAALGKLRKPTVGAWVLNQLVRDQPEVGEQLGALGAELRRAQEKLSGDALRQFASQRQKLVAALVRSARRIAAREGHPVSAATAFEVEQTLHAALADPDVAEEVGSGRLTRSITRTGFDAEAPPAARPPKSAPARPVRRLRAVRDDEVPDEDAAADRERRRREQERERLREEARVAAEARDESEEAYGQAEQRLAAAERARSETAAAAEDLRRRLAEAEEAERAAVLEERHAQRTRHAAARLRDAAARRATDLAARLADLEG